MNESFVTKLDIAFIGSEPITIIDPSWDQVMDALTGFESNEVGRITISNPEEVIVMLIHGQAGAYHIGICEKEINFYYFRNDLPKTSERRDIACNIFDAHQVCGDFETLLKIAEYFYRTGERLDDVKWECDEL